MTDKCHWCGRFIDQYRPPELCCDRPECVEKHNAEMSYQINRHNEKLAASRPQGETK